MPSNYTIYKKSEQNRFSKAFVYISIIDAFQVYCIVDKLFPNNYVLGLNTENSNPHYYEIEFIDALYWKDFHPQTSRLKDITDFKFTLN